MLSQDLRHWQARIVSLVMLGHFQEVRRRRKRPQPRVERSGERSGTLGTDMNRRPALKERQTFVYRLARMQTI